MKKKIHILQKKKEKEKKKKKEEERKRRREEEEKNNQKQEEEMKKMMANIYNSNCNSMPGYNFNNSGNSNNQPNTNYEFNFNDNSNLMFKNSQLSHPSSFGDSFPKYPKYNINYQINNCNDEIIKKKLNELAIQKERNRLEIEEARKKCDEEINQINEEHKKELSLIQNEFDFKKKLLDEQKNKNLISYSKYNKDYNDLIQYYQNLEKKIKLKNEEKLNQLKEKSLEDRKKHKEIISNLEKSNDAQKNKFKKANEDLNQNYMNKRQENQNYYNNEINKIKEEKKK
jgi:hypothetical protein